MTEKKEKTQPDPLEKRDLSEKTEQELVRREKMQKLSQEGVELFPRKVEMTHLVFDIVSQFTDLTNEELEEKGISAVVPGRILSIRKMGRAIFLHIADSRAKLQVYLREDKLGKDKFSQFSLLDIGDIISVEGKLFKTRTGELTLLCESYTFLAKCLHPLPEKWHGLQDVELRYRKRYLDLMMNPE
jgi:lysyl-tRNA synthetase class 2